MSVKPNSPLTGKVMLERTNQEFKLVDRCNASRVPKRTDPLAEAVCRCLPRSEPSDSESDLPLEWKAVDPSPARIPILNENPAQSATQLCGTTNAKEERVACRDGGRSV